MPDFESDLHFSFPDSKILDTSEVNWSNKISDKTTRDMIFYKDSYEDYFLEGIRWK